MKLASTENEAEAQLWLDVLKDNGIPAYIHNTDPLWRGIHWLRAYPARFSQEVWVRADQMADAQEILGL